MPNITCMRILCKKNLCGRIAAETRALWALGCLPVVATRPSSDLSRTTRPDDGSNKQHGGHVRVDLCWTRICAHSGGECGDSTGLSPASTTNSSTRNINMVYVFSCPTNGSTRALDEHLRDQRSDSRLGAHNAKSA